MKSIGSRLSTLLSRMEDGDWDTAFAVPNKDYPPRWSAEELEARAQRHLSKPNEWFVSARKVRGGMEVSIYPRKDNP